MKNKNLPLAEIGPIILFTCSCPPENELQSIPDQDCPVNLKQIQRYAFQRAGSPFDTTLVAPAVPTDIGLLADWQAAQVAADDTKIVISPLIGGDPVIVAGDAITNGGGDNSTLNGVEEVEGTNPSAASAVFKSLKPEVEVAMKALKCETKLTVYLILQGGRIGARQIAPGIVGGFPVQSYFFGDRDNQGNATQDTNAMSFQLQEGWSEELVVFDAADLDFNPIIDL